MQPFDNFTYC